MFTDRTSAFGQLWDRISSWARLSPQDGQDSGSTLPMMDDRVSYRLLRWPDLGQDDLTARRLGALSVMTSRPVNAAWFARRVGCKPKIAWHYLEQLVAEGWAVRIAPGWREPD